MSDRIPRYVVLVLLAVSAQWPAEAGAAVTADCFNKPDCVYRQPEDAISYCWAADSAVRESDFVPRVLSYMQEIEQVAHIDFIDINDQGTCPSPLIDSEGHEVHEANLRIMLAASGYPLTKADRGPDCEETANDPPNQLEGSKFANSPWRLEGLRGCRYNVLLRDSGDRRWGVQHEVSHALGLIHEFARTDAVWGWESETGTTCEGGGIGGPAVGYVTKYDIDSTSQYDRCGHVVYGLSFFDKIALQAMYPEPSQSGDVVIRARTWLQETEASPEYKKTLRGVVAANGALL